MTEALDSFVRFADEQLYNHSFELAAVYKQHPLSTEEINNAYKTHGELFSKELNEEIRKLNQPENAELEARLKVIKEEYEKKLVIPENEALINQKIRHFL